MPKIAIVATIVLTITDEEDEALVNGWNGSHTAETLHKALETVNTISQSTSPAQFFNCRVDEVVYLDDNEDTYYA